MPQSCWVRYITGDITGVLAHNKTPIAAFSGIIGKRPQAATLMAFVT